MCTIEKKSVRVGKMVNSEHVDTVIKNYKQERWIHNSKRLGKEDSLSVWYSIEELEEFMAIAKAHGSDGVRLYFGAYDKENAPKELYNGRQTVVFVATKFKETENGGSNKDLYITTEEGNSILAYNAGALCPPFCKQFEGEGGGIDIGITILDKGEDGLAIA